MATIALHANKLSQMPEFIKSVKKSVEEYKSELSALRTKALSIDNSVCDLYDVIDSIQASTKIQEEKIESLENFQKNSVEFISEVIRIDNDVEEIVKKRKEDFYGKYEYLRPECEKEKGFFEKVKDVCKKVGEICKEYWEAIVVIVVAAVVIAAVVIIFPAAGPILLSIAKSVLLGALKGALYGAGFGGLISGLLNKWSGGSFLEGFASGALSGAAMGALLGGIGGLGKGVIGIHKVVTWLGGCTKALKIVKYTSMISEGFAAAMDAFDLLVFGVELLNPSNPLVSFNKKMHSNKLYSGFQIVVNVVAAFSGGAYDWMKKNPNQICFVAGTLVLTATGLVAIENIKAGEQVAAGDPETGIKTFKTVLRTFLNETTELVQIRLGGETIMSTSMHPFYVVGAGWVSAEKLVTGSRLLLANGGQTIIENVAKVQCEKPVEVYNFEVAELHTYYVAKCGVLVHNDCGGIESGSTTTTSKPTYKPSPKHDPTSGWGSPNPIPDIETGQNLLDTAYSSSKNKQLYNIYDNQLIKFQPDTVDGWHSYLVENPAKEVPTDVLRKMLEDNKITKVQYKDFIKNNKR